MNQSSDELGTVVINPERRIVRIAKWYESYFGRQSAFNLCVTEAMRDDLEENWNIK